jgi:hypothetical protein
MDASYTTRDSVRLMCKSILTRLENQKSISYPARLRQIVQDEVVGLIGPYVLTEQDLRERTLARMGARADLLEDQQFAETDQYRAAKSVVRQGFGDDSLNGFYFQKPLKTVAQLVRDYLMRSSHIDEVYETDDDLDKMIVDIVRKFRPSEAH